VSAPRRDPRKWYALLIVPFVVPLYVPFYNRVEPSLGGVPFFYWYLFLWIILAAVIVGVVFLMTRERRDA
jgi:hypothetical protein